MQWKFQITTALIAHDLLDVVTGDKQRPPEARGGANEAAQQAARQEIKACIKEDAKAMQLMSTVMEPEQMVHLLTCTSSKEMWDRLTVIHLQKSANNQLLGFYGYRMESTDSVQQHISKVQNLASQLIALGTNIPDVLIMSKIISSLPHKFRNFRSAWSSVDPVRQTLEYLQQRLAEEEAYMDKESDESIALAAATSKVMIGGFNSSKKKNTKSRKPKKNVECYVCQERGHYARECPKRKQSQQGKPQQSRQGLCEPMIISRLVRTIVSGNPRSSIRKRCSGKTREKSGLPTAEHPPILPSEESGSWSTSR